jgi:hypothetical protein
MTMPLSFASLRARVHLPSIPLSQFSEARNEALALLFASLVFSAVALIVAPNLRDSLLLQLVGVGLGVFTLAVLFLLFRWFFSRTTAQPLLGPWVYTVYLTGSKKPYAHAYAFFTMSRGRLSLNAWLCPDASSAARAAQGEKVSSSLADLDSRAVAWDRGKLWILYQIRYYNPPRTREGHLEKGISSSTFTKGRGRKT